MAAPCKHMNRRHFLLRAEEEVRLTPENKGPEKPEGSLGKAAPVRAKVQPLSKWCQAENNSTFPLLQARVLFLPQPLGSSTESRDVKNILSTSCCRWREILTTGKAGPGFNDSSSLVTSNRCSRACQPFQRARWRGY